MKMIYEIFECFKRNKEGDDYYEIFTKISQVDSLDSAIQEVYNRLSVNPMRDCAKIDIYPDAAMRVMLHPDKIVAYGWFIKPTNDVTCKIGETYTFGECTLSDGRWPDDEVPENDEKEYFK